MAAKSNTVASTNVASTNVALSAEEREATVRALQAQLLAGLGNANQGNGIWGWLGDKISTTGQGFSSIAAGGSAAIDNFSLHYNSEKLRQQKRTADMAAKLANQLLESQGL